MTAVIGILNKHGLAIAADSACTITKSNNRKIITTANKMLRLCDNQQISLMIAGNALYGSTPWDIIVRRFRQLNGQKQYDTVRDSACHFLDYLRYETIFNSDEDSNYYRASTTTLVFSGFGEKEDMPSLLALEIQYDIEDLSATKETRFIQISDDTPAAICPFAQADTMNAILYGINSDDEAKLLYELSFDNLFETIKHNCDYSQYEEYLGINMLSHDYASQLDNIIRDEVEKIKQSTMNEWLDTVKDYSLHDMASLAENLVSVTAFDRIMRFEEEGVGGLVDLAVISKVNGFTWLNRKSWYNHKDVGGQYGSLGV